MRSPIIPTSSRMGENGWVPWLALAVLLVAWVILDPIAVALNHPLSSLLDLPLMVGNTMSLPHYALLMVIRLLLDMAAVGAICAILAVPRGGFPLWGPNAGRFMLLGLMTGSAVMIAAIGAIIAIGSAHVSPSGQGIGTAAAFGTGWLVCDFIGAAGEELWGRVAVLLVAERFFGPRGAILASGFTFSLLHLGNPGASWIWLFRLFVQGLLLAFAVYRTRSFWWSAGYHAGWNWASAPLFGAVGSGYLDQGHILDFHPTGSIWVTGGDVGPEGSIFAFLAIAGAFVLLIPLRTRATESKTGRGKTRWHL